MSLARSLIPCAAALGLVGIAPAVAAAQSAPACVPSTIDASAQQDGEVTLSPLPGSRDASADSQISFLGVPADEITAVRVVGSRTGLHSGHIYAYSQGDGASFVPSHPFDESEHVSVTATLDAATGPQSLSDSFTVARQDSISTTPETIHPGTAQDVQYFSSRPDLRPPRVTVTADTPAASAGYIFAAPYTGPGQAGPMILDGAGALIWFKPLPTDTFATNFEVQQYDGQPALTWWQGDISVHGFGLGEDVIYNDRYVQIARVRAGNGKQADLHEFQLTPAGTALVTAYDPILCNLSAARGPAYGGLVDAVFQEIDVHTGLVMYEWTSVDHVPLSESYVTPGSETVRDPYDFFHINSISVDSDGSLLVSGRNTWAIYNVSPQTGQINWRLGGAHSTYTSSSEVRTAFQHDPRQLPDGDFSIFDNGASPLIHTESRAIVVSIDAETGQATLVSQFEHSAPVISESQGDVQAQPDGNWFVGWGQTPLFSEFSPEGKLVFDAHLPAFTQSYRTFRFPWTGRPEHRPAEDAVFPAGSAKVFASWNGATGVASWRVLAGSSASRLRVIAAAPRDGFETAIAVPGSARGQYLAVQALSAAGAVLGQSVPARS